MNRQICTVGLNVLFDLCVLLVKCTFDMKLVNCTLGDLSEKVGVIFQEVQHVLLVSPQQKQPQGHHKLIRRVRDIQPAQ